MGQPTGYAEKAMNILHYSHNPDLILGADPRRFGGDREKRPTAFDSALKILQE